MSDGLSYGGLAYGWIPFTVVLVFCLLFSVVYVLRHRAQHPRHTVSTIVTILGLFFALVSSLLVPLDVLLVTSMKNSDGTWTDWAETTEVRDTIKNSMLYTYYGCYSVVLVFCFLLFPATFFKSVKFTLVSLLLFSLLSTVLFSACFLRCSSFVFL